MSILEDIAQAVVAGDKNKVLELTQKTIVEKLDPMTIINQGLVAGMDIVGPRFKNGEMFIPEVLQSAASMHAAWICSSLISRERSWRRRGLWSRDGGGRPARHREESGRYDA